MTGVNPILSILTLTVSGLNIWMLKQRLEEHTEKARPNYSMGSERIVSLTVLLVFVMPSVSLDHQQLFIHYYWVSLMVEVGSESFFSPTHLL